VFSPAHVHLIVNTLDQDLAHPGIWDFWHAYVSRLRETLRLCDAATVTNAYLAARLRAEADIPVAIVPNAVNALQLELSDRLFAGKQARGFARAVDFQIGYFSGTPSHEKDFAIAESAIAAVMERHQEVRLRVVGFLRERDRFRRFKGRIEYYPLHDFLNLQRLIAYSELNIVPLQDNLFTNCKSELKFFEAAIVGTPTIATPTYTYRRAIRPGETGFLALAHEWEQAIESILADLSALARIGSAAREAARDRYAPQAQADVLRAAFFGSDGLLR
jgi:glycosyltransferase involved in cell wall biosynthesis